MAHVSINEQLPTPWDENPLASLAQLQSQVPSDISAVAVWNVGEPQVDELLAARGINASVLTRWLRTGFSSDPALTTAMRQGVALTENPEGEARLVNSSHVMVVMLPESLRKNRWWWLLMGRQSGAFNEQEQQIAENTLKRWHVYFNRPPERDMGVVLIGHDQRVVLADLTMQQRLQDQPTILEQLLEGLQPVVQQRFPNLGDATTRDLAVSLEGKSTWVRFRRDRAVNTPQSEHWFLELRPLEDGELPTVGRVEDPRIALAIAYLHENFHNAPSLAQIARAVHTSPFHFHRLFSKQVGISPKQYLQRKQLQVAKWMLRAGNEPIGQIAVATGFASHGHFTSTFHRIIGVSPSDYRDQHRV